MDRKHNQTTIPVPANPNQPGQTPTLSSKIERKMFKSETRDANKSKRQNSEKIMFAVYVLCWWCWCWPNGPVRRRKTAIWRKCVKWKRNFLPFQILFQFIPQLERFASPSWSFRCCYSLSILLVCLFTYTFICVCRFFSISSSFIHIYMIWCRNNDNNNLRQPHKQRQHQHIKYCHNNKICKWGGWSSSHIQVCILDGGHMNTASDFVNGNDMFMLWNVGRCAELFFSTSFLRLGWWLPEKRYVINTQLAYIPFY